MSIMHFSVKAADNKQKNKYKYGIKYLPQLINSTPTQFRSFTFRVQEFILYIEYIYS